MLRLLKRLTRDESGQDLAEYAIGLVLLALALFVAVNTLRFDLNTIWAKIEHHTKDLTD